MIITEIEKEKKDYRISFLLKEEDALSLYTLIEKNGGIIKVKFPLVKIRIAYPIKKQSFGFSGSCIFSGEAQTPVKITREVKFDTNVIRFMITAKKEKEENNSNNQSVEDASHARARRKGTKTSFKKIATELSNEALEKKLEEIMQ